MIWNIVKKDLVLLRWMIAFAAATQAAYAAIVILAGLWPGRDSQFMLALFAIGQALAIALLILRALQLDAPAGVRQDWLTRPIGWPVMLAAKAVFVLLTVFLPMLVCNLAVGFTHGYGPGDAFATALGNAVLVTLEISLPLFMIGAVCSSVTQAFAVTIAMVLAGIFAVAALPRLLDSGTIPVAFSHPGQAWVKSLARDGVFIAGAAVVLALAYRSRLLLAARIALGIVAILAVGASLLPFDLAFTVQQWAASEPKLGDGVQVSYDATLSPFSSNGVSRDIFRFLPVKISGLPPHSILHMEDMKLRVVSEDGQTLYAARNVTRFFGDAGNDGSFTLTAGNTGDEAATIRRHQTISIPAEDYARISGQPVRVVADYAFSLLTRSASVRAPLLFSQTPIDGLGICESRASTSYSKMVEIGCYPAREFSSCLSVTVSQGKQSHKPLDWCMFPMGTPSVLSAESRLSAGKRLLSVRISDGPDLPEQPLAAGDAADSDMVIDSFAPKAFFRRHYETPLVYLDALKAVPGVYQGARWACRLGLWVKSAGGKEVESSRDIGLTIRNGGAQISVDANAFIVPRVGFHSPDQISGRIFDSPVDGPFFGTAMVGPGTIQIDRTKKHVTLAADVAGGKALADGECHAIGGGP